MCPEEEENNAQQPPTKPPVAPKIIAPAVPEFDEQDEAEATDDRS